jgi:undecaprenyl-diphosphatase
MAWLLWALSISLAQVYVGKHYPLDVLGGALLGSGLALVGATVFNRYFGQSR